MGRLDTSTVLRSVKLVTAATLLFIIYAAIVSNFNSGEMRQWTSDNQNTSHSASSIETQITQRNLRMTKWCSNRTKVDYIDYRAAKHYLHGYDWMYIPQFKLFYCSIPKVASTTMKQSLLEALGVEIAEDADLHDLAAAILSVQEDNPRTSEFDVPLARSRRNPFIERDAESRSLVIVRNPYDRLISAYRDKIINQRKEMSWYCSNYPPAASGKVSTTFSEFINCVLSNYESKTPFYDDHIYPMSRACGICLIHYDIIAKVENFIPEISYTLTQLSGDTTALREKLLNERRILNPSRQSDRLTEKSSISLYRELSDRQLAGLREMYQSDFELFGYDQDLHL